MRKQAGAAAQGKVARSRNRPGRSEPKRGSAEPIKRYPLPDPKKAISLIDKWLADESGHDERTWPVVQELLEENRLSERRRLAD